MKTITAANSVYLLSIGGIYPVAQKLEGYAADAAFMFDSVTSAETVQGVDGKMSAGWVPFLTVQTISIMPDSPSLSMFETWQAASKAAREIFYADATIVLPSIGRKYVLTKGVLSVSKVAPDVKKVLSAMEFKITWESVDHSLI
jgi:hypothetical protein